MGGGIENFPKNSNAGNQTITLTGEASGSGTGSLPVTLDNSAVTGKLLTGFVSEAGDPSATDSILAAFEKIDGNQQLAQRKVGNIVKNEFLTVGELSDYVNVGAATFGFNAGGGLDVSGGSGNFTSYFKSTWNTFLVDWKIEAEFVTVTDGSGIAFGTLGLYGLIDLNTAGNRGTFYIYGDTSPTLLATSTAAVSFTTGDTLKMILTRAGTFVTLQIENVTLSTKSDVLSYTQTLGLTASNSLQTIGNAAIFAYGGSQTVSSFIYSSDILKNSDILLMGDSNTEGWGQAYNTVTSATDGNLNTTFAYRLMAMTKKTVARMCRRGGLVADAYNCISEALLINPKYAVIHLGTNDAISSRTQVQFLADIDNIITSLVAAGITPILCKIIPNTNGASNTLITSYNSGLVTNYSGKYTIIDTSSTNINVTDDTGGTHLNIKGAAKFAELVADGLASIGATAEKKNIFENYFFNFQTPSASRRVNLHLYPLNAAGASLGPRIAGRLQTTTAGSEVSVTEWYGHNASGTQTMLAQLWGGRFGIGGTVGVQPTATLAVIEATIGNPVYLFQTTSTNDDPYITAVQGRATTTDATVTTLRAITISASQTYYVKAIVIARRTGGASGTAEDGAVYELLGAFKTVAGVVTQIGTTIQTIIGEDQAGWDATFDISGTSVRVRVTGAANNNITWHCPELKYSSVGS